MAVKYEKIEKTNNVGLGSDESVTEEHPAFGIVGISRIHSSSPDRLFGSSIRRNPTSVRLRIRRAKRVHNLSEDWYFGKGELVDVELTSAQFADLLTHMNIGDGVPCTIRSVDNVSVPRIPEDDSVEVDRICDGFKEDVRAKSKEIVEIKNEIREILNKKTINKGDRKAIGGLLEKMTRQIVDSAPFVVDMLAEASEKIGTEVKKEAEAFMSMAVERAGIKTLSEMSREEQKGLLLEQGDYGKYGVHADNCCKIHGCKYGEDDCPVVNGLIDERSLCMHCVSDGEDDYE